MTPLELVILKYISTRPYGPRHKTIVESLSHGDRAQAKRIREELATLTTLGQIVRSGTGPRSYVYKLKNSGETQK
jgi:archaellum component FlaG (FlaF/FlaG flagellin family)